MAKYMAITSDKSRRKALRRLLYGGIGLHLFYVGRIGAGLLRLILGALLWVLTFTGITEGEPAMLISGIVFLIAINSIDLFKLLLGTFRDNTGAVLRE